MENQATTIFVLMGVQFALYAVAWALFALIGGDDHKAATYWSLFNVLIGAGMALAWSRDETRGWWAYVGGPLCFIGAFMAAWRGVTALMHQEQKRWSQLAVLVFVASGLLWAGPGLEHAQVRVFFTYLGSAIIIALAIRQIRFTVRSEFNGRLTRVLRFSSRGTVVVLGGRGLQQLIWPSSDMELNAHAGSNLLLLLSYLVMGAAFNFSCLGVQILRYVRRLHELTQRDPLTGLLNRRAFDEETQREWQRRQRQSAPLVVAAFDLDHFKLVNDNHGHGTGDLVLAHTARILHGEAREVDLVARMGGEEFVVVMPGATLTQGLLAAERIREKLASAAVRSEAGESLYVTASIGVADAWDGDADIHAVLKRADAALYRAKHEGRNRVCQAEGEPVVGEQLVAIVGAR